LEVAKAGGVRALVTLARSCKLEGVLEQVKRRSHLHSFFFFLFLYDTITCLLLSCYL